jgi:hypothetical protein
LLFVAVRNCHPKSVNRSTSSAAAAELVELLPESLLACDQGAERSGYLP